jgi:hypothetical protein
MPSGFERLVAKRRKPPPGAGLQGDLEPGAQHVANEMHRIPGVPQYMRGERAYAADRWNQRFGTHGRKKHKYT